MLDYFLKSWPKVVVNPVDFTLASPAHSTCIGETPYMLKFPPISNRPDALLAASTRMTL